VLISGGLSVISVAVAAGDLPGALSMADLAASDPMAAGQPMTLFRRIIALALAGNFDTAIAEASGMWEAWLRTGPRKDTLSWPRWAALRPPCDAGTSWQASSLP
jgi:hypothetical protein